MNHDSDTSRDHALSILGQDSPDPWGRPEPGPSTLMVAVGGEHAPSTEWIRDVLGAQSENEDAIVELDQELDGPPFALWSMVLSFGSHPVPVVVWSEQVTEPDSLPPLASGGRWMIGIQTVLDPESPLAMWNRMACLLVRCSPEVLCLFDQETEQWFAPDEIARYLLGSVPMTHEGMLFRVHATATSERPEEADSIWLHTQGLHRCGCPELELLELPAKHLGVAHEMLEALGALFINHGVPDPGVRFEAGTGVALVLDEWKRSVEFLGEHSVGGLEHRMQPGAVDENPLTTGRAVVCGPDPVGSFRKVLVWPQAAIAGLEAGTAALERTPAWTASRASVARSLWPRFLELHAQGRPMLACVSVESGPENREHIWIEVSQATATSLLGHVTSNAGSGTHRAGDSVSLDDLDSLIDWYSPEDESIPRGDA